MQTTDTTKKDFKEPLSDKEAIEKTRKKMKQELEKPAIKAVFQRLKDK